MNTSNLFNTTEIFSIDCKRLGKEVREPIQHFHDSFEFDFFLQADLHLFIEDTQYHIRDGDLLLICPYDIHRIFYSPDHDYERYVIQFKVEFIQELLNVLDLPMLLQDLQHNRTKLIRLDLQQRTQMIERFRSLLDNYNKWIHQDGSLRLSATLKLELTTLLLNYYELSKLPRTYITSRQDDQVQKIIRYIDMHYKTSVSLEILEQYMLMNKYHICHLFKLTTRFTIGEYLQYRRIVEAQKLLSHTDMPIINVGFECGFQSLQHFYRTFKKSCGRTPKQYRISTADSFNPY